MNWIFSRAAAIPVLAMTLMALLIGIGVDVGRGFSDSNFLDGVEFLFQLGAVVGAVMFALYTMLDPETSPFWCSLVFAVFMGVGGWFQLAFLHTASPIGLPFIAAMPGLIIPRRQMAGALASGSAAYLGVYYGLGGTGLFPFFVLVVCAATMTISRLGFDLMLESQADRLAVQHQLALESQKRAWTTQLVRQLDHEIRNPLGVILAENTMIQHELDDLREDRIGSAVTRICSHLDEMRQVLDDYEPVPA